MLPNKISKQKNRFLLPVIMVGCVIVLIIFFVSSKQSFQERIKNSQNSQIKQDKIKTEGKFFLQTEFGQNIYNPGDEISIVLYGDSQGQEIGGYDSVLTYDTNVLTFKKGENIIEGFELFTSEKEKGVLSLTGVKNLQSTQIYKLSNTALATLTFTADDEGLSPLSFVFIPGKTNDSNIVTVAAEDILGSAQGVVIYVGENVTLTLQKLYSIPQTSMKVTLKSIEIPEPVCKDCETSVELVVSNGKSQETLRFITGGIGGAQLKTSEAFGYVFEVSDIKEKSVVLRFAPKN
ncbi:hypothetical protein A3H80_01425 [Candidatus Roizmanbacteria bacterium RIFCSPLOWO2_02_FULL_37_19]|uniref:Cohesin domain-containing protein n=1 Tax=Candidatus Roizmanbacteria bacterium RIFCSPHIGHO2_02_FULL_37_24 TaxID=1802037 RepID=A0A1F7GVR7_9BACT|nr:MAG: hypothetical protein A2862_01445 [Candidatus Roizmanbacteria bacterium RIFCSPHIGHO2_01_FULL_38_41]OGK23001.1 MAG: hypothetical protein A3C24_02580 [Candidatus Roizmanbacteria bacterium RIFCSPHIGHO2_02_FULL_37_24]OGK32218.1 MAG: hypothetical protein A3E10_02145 [Candidatus Roizmanbacteria bacterium RIFCSPHIGHO2_12_FULL_37_23]OGK45646.1 MAG: hypothetical protein A2956_00645 [Candidatus Roizmanbacteria bacterium RIFCSPLOWO2_01_FULL_37_57]OGK53851.1 MAG: hypothetical protein A3H80_01425 [Ca